MYHPLAIFALDYTAMLQFVIIALIFNTCPYL